MDKYEHLNVHKHEQSKVVQADCIHMYKVHMDVHMDVHEGTSQMCLQFIDSVQQTQ